MMVPMVTAWNLSYPDKRLALIKSFGGVCMKCSYDNIQVLEFAHIKPTDLNGRGRGRWDRYYDVKNNPDKYALLCNLCHDLLDEDPVLFVASLEPEQVRKFYEFENR